jgi:polysaccharide biosynthesis protein PslG
MSVQSTLARTRVRKQLRGFVLIWTGITVVMGACTFIAIYAAYGALAQNTGSSGRNNLALPGATSTSQVALNATAIPTREVVRPTATIEPTAAEVSLAQAAVATDTLPPAPTATLLPVRDTSYQVGIQVQQALDFNPAIQDQWMGEVHKLGLSWFKQQIRWEDFEHEEGTYDWRILDLVMPAAQRAGLKVMLSIVTAPEWAREPGADLSKHGPPANNQQFVDFVTAILERYPNEVHAIEVWNEMNIDREWSSTRGLSAANYVALLRDTYTAIKEIDPGIIVISGALSPTGFNDGVGAWDDYIYLDQLISAGMLNYIDCVGAHANGYNLAPDQPWDQVVNDPTAAFRGPFDNPHHSWSFYSTIRTYASKVAAAGGEQKVCVTEFGWAVTEDLGGTPLGFEFANDNTLEEQAEFTIHALELMEEWDVVWLAFIWNLNYGPQAGWATDNDNVPYSIIGKDWAFRPVYDAIIEWGNERKAAAP